MRAAAPSRHRRALLWQQGNVPARAVARVRLIDVLSVMAGGGVPAAGWHGKQEGPAAGVRRRGCNASQRGPLSSASGGLAPGSRRRRGRGEPRPRHPNLAGRDGASGRAEPSHQVLAPRPGQGSHQWSRRQAGSGGLMPLTAPPAGQSTRYAPEALHGIRAPGPSGECSGQPRLGQGVVPAPGWRSPPLPAPRRPQQHGAHARPNGQEHVLSLLLTPH
ncbi:MAG: hypothetical protein J3K34DRAFT_430594 [Monoraphidium minutum]|nr:MAG: hypothetical protein J3K34DRAFT_430594 [Monoraphidium minutum]